MQENPQFGGSGAVFCGLVGLLVFLYLLGQLPGSRLHTVWAPRTYRLSACFDTVGGLNIDSPVKLGGVWVGRVGAIDYDAGSGQARVALDVDARFDRIPVDSMAAIQTAGLLGGNFVAILPGGSTAHLPAGGRFALTQSALVMENLINKLMAGLVTKAGSGASANPNSAP